MSAAGGVSSENLFEGANVSLVKINGLLETVCGELARVPSTVERLSRVDGILPPGHGFDAESSKEVCQFKLDFLMSFVRALPTSGLALGYSRICRMLVASVLKMRLLLLSDRCRGKIMFVWVVKEATWSIPKRFVYVGF